MSDKKAEGAKPEGEAKPAAGDASQGGSGGLKAWMPLLVTIVLMPVLAFTTTKFLILPKVVQARGGGESAGHDAAGGESGHDATKDPGDHGKPKDGKDAKGPAKKKQTVPITKVIVNVAGSMGARYLMASFTLVGTHADFKTIVEENKDQLLDLANTAMASKTITELEKPGARNQLRAELMTIFNNALGGGIIQEIYFTEFAVQ
jgi:flagellar basal body-associated protein FliL